MSTRTVIRGGLVITASDELHADVLMEDGRIAALAASHTPAAEALTAERTIDATGKYVIPGGVDAHTHMELPFGGTFASDTFETGTRAAAWGGTTTIVDFAVQSVGHTLREGLDAWHAKAEGNCAIDYAFHMIVSDVNDETLKEMDLLVEEGVASFKQFMAYPGVLLLRRRTDPPRHATLRRQRRPDHDARRERHYHRRPRRTGPRPRRDRPPLPRRGPQGPPGGGGHPPRHPARPGRRRPAVRRARLRHRGGRRTRPGP
ncbi:D-phenylhydantoinase [Streptomyces griseoloalbus]